MASQIPIVDFAPVLESSTPTSEWGHTVEQIDTALSKTGFVYLVNHGVPTHFIADSFRKAKAFFELPTETKMIYKKAFSPGATSVKDYNGYSGPGNEMFDEMSKYEMRETYDMIGRPEAIFYPSDEHVPGFKTSILQSVQAFKNLSEKINQVLAVALGLDNVNFFNDNMKALSDPNIDTLNDLRVVYYPSTPVEDVDESKTRCSQHTDYGIFTCLVQDEIGGLEVKTVAGDWIAANPVKDAILVNTGDLLEFWSNGHFPATYHRVQFPKIDSALKMIPMRQSIAYFLHPDDNVMVSPLKTKYSTKKFEGAKPVQSYEYIMSRAKTAYRLEPELNEA
jgi:isopenicillin N synthase-like dioxygenase